MDSLIGSALFAASCFFVFLCFRWFDRRLLISFGLMFVAYLVLDDIMTGLPNLLPSTAMLPGQWNWTGKLFSLVFSGIVFLALRIDPKAAGLTWKQKNLPTALVAFVCLTLTSFAIGFLFKPDAPDMETVAFQALMPGLAEEIAYRGIAPALLMGLIRSRPPADGMPWAVVLITGIAFGIWHGLGFSHGHITFDVMSSVFPMLGGILYGWLRFHTGSVVLPIVAHGLGNNVFFLWRLF